MGKEFKGFTRREFLGLTAAGAAGLTLTGLGVPSVFGQTPKRGGTVKCGMSFLMQTPDPHRFTGAWARQHIALCWEGLTTPTSRSERVRIVKEKGPDVGPPVQPMLAESWDVEKGGTRYVFHLRQGVKFHNGKDLDSEDVRWSWERVRNPKHRATGRKILTTFLDTIETPDKYTVVANLTQPYSAFLIANAWCNTVILPKDSIPEGVVWGSTQRFKPPTVAPPGTGPFQLVEFKQGHRSVFKAFKDYREAGLPYLDEVIFMVISEDTPRTMAVRSGDVDYIWSSEDNWYREVMQGQMDKLFELIHYKKENLITYPALGDAAVTIFLNCHEKVGDSPFKDVRVRQALDYCIDKPKLCKALYGDLMIPMAQAYHWSNSPWGFKDIEPKVPDIEKAKRLMKEAGYPDGLDVELKFTPSWGKNDLMAQIVQQMAKPAGFRIKLTPEVGVQYWHNLRVYSYQMLVFSMGGDDPMSMIYPYLHTDPAPPYSGYSPSMGVKDPVLDQLLDDMAAEIDLQKRKAKFKKVVLRINEMSYCIPYGLPVVGPVWRPRLKNFKPYDYFFPEQAFKEAWVEG